MDSKSPMEILEAEHHVIQKIVGAMAVLAEGLGAGQEPPVETLRNIVEFMRTFADKCHHGKEEAHLFPFLERRGVPARGCPIGVLIHEHERGRTLVAQLAQATEASASGTASARDAVAEILRGLMELYPNHIWKEEYLLFPMSNKVLGAADQQQLIEQFAAVEAAVGRDVHQRFERIAEEIAQGSHVS
jgi:hemerythrin-like domain-containing protein